MCGHHNINVTVAAYGVLNGQDHNLTIGIDSAYGAARLTGDFEAVKVRDIWWNSDISRTGPKQKRPGVWA